MNLKNFPLEYIKDNTIISSKDLTYFMLLGFCAFAIFHSCVQCCWRIGIERQMGTLNSILLSPISMMKWIYGRTVAFLVVNGWIYFIILFYFHLIFFDWRGMDINHFNMYVKIVLVISIGVICFTSCLLMCFVLLRDSTFVYSIIETGQATFSGVRVPLNISPTVIQVIGAIIPLTYTINLVRAIVFESSDIFDHILLYVLVNCLLIGITQLVKMFGVHYLRTEGNADLY